MEKREEKKEEEQKEVEDKLPKLPELTVETGDDAPLDPTKLRLLSAEQFSDKLEQTKLLLGRKRNTDGYLDKRAREKMMREYATFDRRGNVDELELTDNVFYRAQVPDQYFIPIDPRMIDRDEYRNTTINKIIKPIVNDDRQTMVFTFTVEDLIEWDGIILKLRIENENFSNFLQLDGDPNILIKSIQLLIDGELLEEHKDWGYNLQFANILTPKDTSFSKTIGDSIITYSDKPLQQGIEGSLIGPKIYGNNLIFNPPTRFRKYLEIPRITDGKIDYGFTNVKDYEIVIRLYTFGNLFTNLETLSTRKNLNDLRGAGKINLVIKMNDQAFFVPVFNARIQDLVNTSVDSSMYVHYRRLKEQLSSLKAYKKTVKYNDNLFDNFPSTLSLAKLDNYYDDIFPVKDTNLKLTSNSDVSVKVNFDVYGNVDSYTNVLTNVFGVKFEPEELLNDSLTISKIEQKLNDLGVNFKIGIFSDPKNEIILQQKEKGNTGHFLIIFYTTLDSNGIISYIKNLFVSSLKIIIKGVRIMYRRQTQIPEVEKLWITNTDFFDPIPDLTKLSTIERYWNKDVVVDMGIGLRRSLYNLLFDKKQVLFEIDDFENIDEYLRVLNPDKKIYYLKKFEATEFVDLTSLASTEKSKETKTIIDSFKPKLELLGLTYDDKSKKIGYKNNVDGDCIWLYDDKAELKNTSTNSLEVNFSLVFLTNKKAKFTFNYFVPQLVNNVDGKDNKLNRLKFKEFNLQSKDKPSEKTNFITKLMLAYEPGSVVAILNLLKTKTPLYNVKYKDKIVELVASLYDSDIERKNKAMEKLLFYLDADSFGFKSNEEIENWIPFQINDDDKIELPLELNNDVLKYKNVMKIVSEVFGKNKTIYSRDIQRLLYLGSLFDLTGEFDGEIAEKEPILNYFGLAYDTILKAFPYLQDNLVSLPYYKSNLTEKEYNMFKPSRDTLIENIGLKLDNDFHVDTGNVIAKNIYTNNRQFFLSFIPYFMSFKDTTSSALNTLIDEWKNISYFYSLKQIPRYIIVNIETFEIFVAPLTGQDFYSLTPNGKGITTKNLKNQFDYFFKPVKKDNSSESEFDTKNLVYIEFWVPFADKEKSGEPETKSKIRKIFDYVLLKPASFVYNVVKSGVLLPSKIKEKLDEKAKNYNISEHGDEIASRSISTDTFMELLTLITSGEQYTFTDKKIKVTNSWDFKDVEAFNNKFQELKGEKIDIPVISGTEFDKLIEYLLETSLKKCYSVFKKISENETYVSKQYIKFVNELKVFLDLWILDFNYDINTRNKLIMIIPLFEKLAYLMENNLEAYKKSEIKRSSDNQIIKMGFSPYESEKIVMSEIVKILVNYKEVVSTEWGLEIGRNATTRTIFDFINEIMNPRYLDQLEMRLISELYNTKEYSWVTQHEFEILNNEKRGISKLDISNEYTLTDALIEIKSMGLDSQPDIQVGLNEVKRVISEIYSGIFDVERDFYLPLRNDRIRRIFIFFENVELCKYPTFRKSTKVSLPLETFALIVGNKIYPEAFFKGKINDSVANKHFLEELAYTLGRRVRNYGDIDFLEKTSVFNRMNYAISESTTEFVTRKLYNLESGSFFKFNEDTSRVVDALFGVDQEVLSQFMLGFDFDRVERQLNAGTIGEVRFTFDYSKLKEFKNKLRIHIFSEYYDTIN